MIKITKKIIIGSLIGLPMISNAQFTTNGPFFNYGFTFPVTIQKIGIGNFPTNGSVQAKLHVSQLLLAADVPTTGLLFRTDGVNAQDNIWSMFTGPSNLTLTEKFRLYIPANSANTVLQTQQPNSRMLFNTNGLINRMLIMDGGVAANAGRIAFGNNLPVGFAPLSRLHLHQTTGINGLRFTTANMLGTANGFEVGYDATSNIQNRQFAQLLNHQNTAMKFFTNGTQRMHINQSRQSAIGLTGLKYNVSTAGYVGIGRNTANIWGTSAGIGRGPYSLLHLNNDAGSPEQSGYRPWMRGGVSFTENVDFGYVGLRSFFDNSGNYGDANLRENFNEFVITWSNNPITGSVGSDDMCFRFTSNVTSAFKDAINTNDFLMFGDLDGRHIARFTPQGNMGIGPTFGEEIAVYAKPRSLLHLSFSNLESVYAQFTNRDVIVNSGTQETVNDGLRIGIRGEQDPNMNGNALMYNQETRHLLFSTNANTNNINIATGTTLERVRITSINAPTNLIGGAYGINNPAALAGNLTRVAISHNPAQPITRPLSLLHLGYNTPTANNDGWRTWMDVGTFTSNTTHNTYVGLKNEGATQDAIVNWGSDTLDNLRFIFTENPTSTNPNGGVGANGLEIARMEPKIASTLTAPNFGMMGIGNFSPTGPNTALTDVIDAKLDIDGDLRIREVTQDNTLTQILAIDPTDHNRVHWVDASSFTGGGGGTVTADNRLSIFPANNVQLGNNVGLTTAQLLNDREIPMNNFNTYFTGQGFNNPFTDNIYLGYPTTTLTPVASKFSVIENVGNVTNVFTYAGHFRNINIATPGFDPFVIGVAGIADQSQSFFSSNVGGYFKADGAPLNKGIIINMDNLQPNSIFSKGIEGRMVNLFGSGDLVGVDFNIINASPMSTNMGVRATVAGGNNINYGLRTAASGALNINYGIFSEAAGPVGSTSFAGFFNGDVVCTGGGSMCPSDVNLKTNITSLNNASSLLAKLSPKYFEFNTANYPTINLPSGLQMGLIAQEVDSILPSIVGTGIAPEERDSLGNLLNAAVTFKTIKYQELIPLLIAGFNEQQTKLDSVNTLVATQDSINTDLETRLATLEACINNTGICNNHGNNDNNGQGNNRENTQIVTLQNLNAIVLDQNLPNPFAESTQINYVIPNDVQKATLLFYDMNGRIINEVNINERGNGTLTVYGENLEKGIYTYSLVADGKLIATKKMLKQ